TKKWNAENWSSEVPEDSTPRIWWWIMPIHSSRIRFRDDFMALVLPAAGVYALWDGDALTLYVWADERTGLRERLRAHKRGGEGPCTQNATHFQFEFAN